MAHLKPATPSPLAVVTATDHGWLIASGEIDMVTAPQLATALEAGDYHGVDLDAVTFMDVSGLRVLLNAARQAHAAGRSFAVARPCPQIRRLLELTAIDQSLEVVEAQSSAVTSR
jgi:anti-sigma B factor antagonist